MNLTGTSTSEQKQHSIAIGRMIGWSFMTMFFLGIFAEFVIRTRLIHWEDPGLTFANIQESLAWFDAGIFAFIVIIILDVVLSVAFYVLCSSIDKPLAMLSVSLRLVYVAIKGFAIVGLFLARDIYAAPILTNTGQTDVYATQAMQFLKMHHYGFGIGLLFFGLHLIFLAILLLKVNRIPKLIVWMLLIAGMGYSMNSLVSFFAADADLLKNITIAIFIIPMTLAELLLGLWLWIKANTVIPLLHK